MNPNLSAILKFLSYVGVIGGLALVQYLQTQYKGFDGSLIQTLLIQAGTGLGFFHLTGSSKSDSQSTGEAK